MTGPSILALIMAGGAGSRMAPLTDHRAKPAVPYAGVYRLIDFPLSNCAHSARPAARRSGGVGGARGRGGGRHGRAHRPHGRGRPQAGTRSAVLG